MKSLIWMLFFLLPLLVLMVTGLPELPLPAALWLSAPAVWVALALRRRQPRSKPLHAQQQC